MRLATMKALTMTKTMTLNDDIDEADDITDNLCKQEDIKIKCFCSRGGGN